MFVFSSEDENNFNGVYKLNEISFLVLNKIRNQENFNQIVTDIVKNYDVDVKNVIEDLKNLICDMINNNIIVIEWRLFKELNYIYYMRRRYER